MPARKRGFEEVDNGRTTTQAQSQPSSPLHKIRNTWEFASLMQYIFFFGQAIKIDKDLDIDMLEAECLKLGHSPMLSEIGLAMLKYVSSHKGLTPEIFDEYTRRQYQAKAPHRNPFGAEEEPLPFADMDILTKVRVLHQLSVWTLNNPDRIREKMEEKDSEQTQWRIEPLGWDAGERSYFVLDDDRLYRRTEPAPPVPPPKADRKPRKTKGKRYSKRQRMSEVAEDSVDEEGEHSIVPPEPEVEEDEGLGGAKWECIAVSFEEYKTFVESIQKSRDADEKALYKRITAEVLPVIEKRAEAQERKLAARRREKENLEKLATAKRSSRIADKSQRQREIQEAEEAERRRKEDLAMAHKDQERQQKIEEARESRMVTREQRLKEREVKRILHEEELARLRASSEQSDPAARLSERNRKLEMERKQKELEKLKEEEKDWYFDCAVCGVHGKNLDDGTHSVACDNCSVWQHSACHGIDEAEAETNDFHFLCASCTKPKKQSLKIRLGPSSSPNDGRNGTHVNGVASKEQPSTMPSVMVSPHYSQKMREPMEDQTTHIQQLHKSHERFASSTPSNGQTATGATMAQAARPHFSPTSVATHQTNGAMHHQHHAFPPQPQQPLHDPFLNHMIRQHPSLPPSFNATSNPQSISQLSQLNGHTISPSNFPPVSTPQMPLSSPHIPHPSPTPSLSATQGNTNIHFSPNPKPAGSPRTSSYVPIMTSSSQISNNTHSPGPAHSPIKSSPTHVHATSPIYQNAGAGGVPQTPLLQSPRAASAGGLSPQKHEVATPGAARENGTGGDTFGNGGQNTLGVQARSRSYTAQTPRAGLDVETLDAKPVLSPTLNACEQNREPLVKRQTLVKVDGKCMYGRDGGSEVGSVKSAEEGKEPPVLQSSSGVGLGQG